MLRNELSLNIILDILFGKSSDHYQKLYSEGLIDDSFSYDYSQEKGFGFAMIGGDTPHPDKLAETLKSMLLTAKQGDNFTTEEFGAGEEEKNWWISSCC